MSIFAEVDVSNDETEDEADANDLGGAKKYLTTANETEDRDQTVLVAAKVKKSLVRPRENLLEQYTTRLAFAQMSAKQGIKKYYKEAELKLIAEFAQVLEFQVFHQVKADGPYGISLEEKRGSGQERFQRLKKLSESAETLMDMGFKLNSYDLCVANCDIDRKQECMICRYLDNDKISHVKLEVIQDIIGTIKVKSRKMTSKYGEEHAFLGMKITLKDGKVEISMKKHI
ncbi:unnamed protein product [Cylindrotheca closterium]|uniref:Uncharacterized protein n=1 Tax=Cylindrotheca closterium TaxID=2856 RepID=A0AAD2CHV5_9STRA|nr:unnamed protein product [Cylindrotheca closterium]